MERATIIDDNIDELRQRLADTERELESVRLRIHRQLELASRVHETLLPQPVRDDRILVDVRYIPVDEVGGDYCHVHFSDRDTCYVAIYDVTGHGIGPALLATRVSSEVRHGILYGREPRDIIRSLNRFICDNFEETYLYLTLIVARIDLLYRRITWSGAGHPSPLLLRRNGQAVQQLKSQNLVIGVVDNCLAKQPESTLDLEPGDRLVFYTDGLSEAVDGDGHCLLTQGLADIIREAASVDLFDMADYVLDRIDRYHHGPTTDDKTLIVAEIK